METEVGTSLGPPLGPHERRVLGVLVEKALTTPDYYPMTVNALVAGCNQKNNRNPVMQLHEADVVRALRALEEHRWVMVADFSARVVRWKHRLSEKLGIGVGFQAILAELLLRGPQQPGELRARASRMSNIPTQEEMMELLRVMASHDPPLVTKYAWVPGERANRYGQTLGPDAPFPTAAADAAPSEDASLAERVARLETEIQEFRAALAALRPNPAGGDRLVRSS